MKLFILIIFLLSFFNLFRSGELTPIDIYSPENSEYYQMLNSSIINQISKHPLHYKYSLIDCLESQLDYSSGLDVEGKNLQIWNLKFICIAEEIQSVLNYDYPIGVFEYNVHKYKRADYDPYFDTLSNRVDYVFLDFDRIIVKPPIAKADLIGNATEFICNTYGKCGEVSFVKDNHLYIDCYYRDLNFTLISERNKVTSCVYI